MVNKKVNVVITGNNTDWMNKIKYKLSENEYEIINCKSGKSALKIIDQKQPEIIISDILLSDMNGFKFLESIHNAKNIELPIFIFFSPSATKSEIRKGMGLGADDFLTDYEQEVRLNKLIEIQIEKRKKLLSLKNKTISELRTKLSENIKTSNGEEKHSTSLEDYIFLDDKTNPGFYAIKDFVFVLSKKDYTQIFMANGKSITIHKTLTFWENFLPEKKFLRIHRQTIINLDFVRKVEKNNSYRFNIFLDGIEQPFVISQRYSKKIKTGWGVN